MRLMDDVGLSRAIAICNIKTDTSMCIKAQRLEERAAENNTMPHEENVSKAIDMLCTGLSAVT